MSEGTTNVEGAGAEENVTLSYARVVPRIRYGWLAIGAGLCVLMPTMGLGAQLVWRMESLSFQTRDWIALGMEWLGYISVFVAVLLIGRAMPPVWSSFRWKFAACLTVSGLAVLFLLGVAVWAVGSEYWRALPAFSETGSISIGLVLSLLESTLVGMGAVALIAITARAGRGRVGILAAAVHVGAFTAALAGAGIAAWEIKDGFWHVHEKIPTFVQSLLGDVAFWGTIAVAVVWGVVAIAAAVAWRRQGLRGVQAV